MDAGSYVSAWTPYEKFKQRTFLENHRPTGEITPRMTQCTKESKISFQSQTFICSSVARVASPLGDDEEGKSKIEQVMIK